MKDEQSNIHFIENYTFNKGKEENEKLYYVL